MRGQPEVVVGAEVDDRLAVDAGVQPAALERPEVRVEVQLLDLAHERETRLGLVVDPAHGLLARGGRLDPSASADISNPVQHGKQ
jgi:hypothetical protein